MEGDDKWEIGSFQTCLILRTYTIYKDGENEEEEKDDEAEDEGKREEKEATARSKTKRGPPKLKSVMIVPNAFLLVNRLLADRCVHFYGSCLCYVINNVRFFNLHGSVLKRWSFVVAMCPVFVLEKGKLWLSGFLRCRYICT